MGSELGVIPYIWQSSFRIAASLPEHNLWRGFVDQNDKLLIINLADRSTVNEARSQQLQRYYNDAEHDNFYDELGRLALGINSDEKLLNTSFTAKRLGEVSYYKGVYEYSKGSYQEAASWFRTTVETRLFTNGEYRWAYGTLYTWANKSTELRIQIEESL